MASKEISGILNINKPAGMTSHDVVNRVRKIIGIKKVGHTGTLDPMATGVLLVCAGKATRLIEYMVGGQKEYQATMRLGEATNTYDAEGEIISAHPTSHITGTMVRKALTTFVGTIQQVPPPFSAIKKDGVPLYKLARKGITVTPAPRTVYIEQINLIRFDAPNVVFSVVCGAGTYIRSIAHDAGQLLGVGAHLTQLTRTANGPWRIETATTLQSLAEAATQNALDTFLHHKELALRHLPQITLSPEEEKCVAMGQFIPNEHNLQDTAIAAYNNAESLIAVLTPREPNLLKPKKVFI